MLPPGKMIDSDLYSINDQLDQQLKRLKRSIQKKRLKLIRTERVLSSIMTTPDHIYL